MNPPDPPPAGPAHPGVVVFEDRRTDPPTVTEKPYTEFPMAFRAGVPVVRVVTVPAGDDAFSILLIAADGRVLQSTRMVRREGT
jgi:hypothetical protein